MYMTHTDIHTNTGPGRSHGNMDLMSEVVTQEFV